MSAPIKRLTLRHVVLGIAALILLAAIVLWSITPPAIARMPGTTLAASPELVQRGAYIARASDCVACHTAVGGKPYAGGLGLDTPFGTIVASNITPDRETGIGGWTDAAFTRAMRQGVNTAGHLLYPAMPYNAYTKMSDADIHALKAYLDTLPAVHNDTSANKLPFPFNIRQMMFGWNLLFFKDARFVPDPKQSAAWNRGAYLVDGPGHCAACHSAKNLLGGDKTYLQGGVLQGWYAPELSGNNHVGLGGWSNAEIVAYLQTGSNPHAVAAGPMAEAVTNSTQFLTAVDLNAIATYLKAQPGSNHAKPTPLAVDDPSMQAGGQVFAVNCAACHASAGTGITGMATTLAGGPATQAPQATNLIRTVLLGGEAAATKVNPTAAAMPGFAWKLSDRQIAAVVTYVRNSWGNAAAPVSDEEVASARKALKADTRLTLK